MTHWRSLLLGDVLTLQRGFDITKAQQTTGPYPVVSSSGINSYHAQFTCDAPGVVIGRKGSLGTVFFLDQPFWAHDTTLWVKDFKGNNSRFCYYLLKYLPLARYDVGASNPTLNRNHLHLLEVRLPCHGAQVRIASILSAYDNLIEVNTCRVAILEEMARRVFDERISRASAKWPRMSLGSILRIEKGLSYKGEGLRGGGLPMVNLKNILREGGFRRDAVKSYSGEFKSRHTVKPGDIVIANTDLTQLRTILASPAIVPAKLGHNILFSHHLYAVRLVSSRFEDFPNFIYGLLQSVQYKDFARSHATGTTVLGLPREAILNYEFPKPPTEIIEHFEQVVSPTRMLIEKLEDTNELLVDARDFLLPKLMAGEIDVERAEHEADAQRVAAE